MTDAWQLNGLTLAYIGDAVLELYVRNHLLAAGTRKPDTLHQQAIRYVAAEAQARVLERLLSENSLNETEYQIVRRGRNAKSLSAPKNTAINTYRNGTAFEALIGYLHLQNDEGRVQQITSWMFDWIEEDACYEG